MRYVFFGTPNFAARILQDLINAGMPPALVVANPDKPAGRKKILTAPETKVLAQKYNIPIYQPEKPTAIAPELSGEWDFFIVCAYAKIIPTEIIKIPRRGVLGVHPSLLPKYRGASPIQSAILGGESKTGITLYLLDEKVDHGDILASNEIPITPGDTHITLSDKLAKLSSELLIKTLPDFLNDKIKSRPQNHDEATFTKKFSTNDGLLDLKKDDPAIMHKKIRALNPEPGVYAFIEKSGKQIRTKILGANLTDGKLTILRIQEEGKKPVAINLPIF